MEKTTREIPDDVYDHARDLQDSGLYEAAFEHIAAWARNEALREAAEVARATTEIPMHSHWGDVIAEGILELVKEEA